MRKNGDVQKKYEKRRKRSSSILFFQHAVVAIWKWNLGRNYTSTCLPIYLIWGEKFNMNGVQMVGISKKVNERFWFYGVFIFESDKPSKLYTLVQWRMPKNRLEILGLKNLEILALYAFKIFTTFIQCSFEHLCNSLTFKLNLSTTHE